MTYPKTQMRSLLSWSVQAKGEPDSDSHWWMNLYNKWRQVLWQEERGSVRSVRGESAEEFSSNLEEQLCYSRANCGLCIQAYRSISSFPAWGSPPRGAPPTPASCPRLALSFPSWALFFDGAFYFQLHIFFHHLPRIQMLPVPLSLPSTRSSIRTLWKFRHPHLAVSDEIQIIKNHLGIVLGSTFPNHSYSVRTCWIHVFLFILHFFPMQI